MIGNGPFQMSEPWVADQYIKLERYEKQDIEIVVDRAVVKPDA